jgi:hypothetical protein
MAASLRNHCMLEMMLMVFDVDALGKGTMESPFCCMQLQMIQ